MNINPMFLLNALKNTTPEKLVMNLISSKFGNNNPMMNNLLSMAKKGDNKGLEEFARNMCKEKGIDFNKEYNNFISNLKQR